MVYLRLESLGMKGAGDRLKGWMTLGRSGKGAQKARITS